MTANASAQMAGTISRMFDSFGHIVLAEQGPSVQVEGCQADKAAVAGDRLAVNRQQRYGEQREQRNADAACNDGRSRSGAVVHEETPI